MFDFSKPILSAGFESGTEKAGVQIHVESKNTNTKQAQTSTLLTGRQGSTSTWACLPLSFSQPFNTTQEQNFERGFRKWLEYVQPHSRPVSEHGFPASVLDKAVFVVFSLRHPHRNRVGALWGIEDHGT